MITQRQPVKLLMLTSKNVLKRHTTTNNKGLRLLSDRNFLTLLI